MTDRFSALLRHPKVRDRLETARLTDGTYVSGDNQSFYFEGEAELTAFIRTLLAADAALPAEEREAAAKALKDKGVWCGADGVFGLECTGETCPECEQYRLVCVDAAAPHLYRALRGENETLALAVRAAADDTKGYLTLIEEMAKVIAAVRRICPSDETTGVTEKFAYVCHGEDGEPILETDSLGEAVDWLVTLHDDVVERAEAAEAELLRLTAENEELRKERNDAQHLAADFKERLRVFGRHKKGCRYDQNPGSPYTYCSCGLEKNSDESIEGRKAMGEPDFGALRLCLICAYEKPWGLYHGPTGVTVCSDCTKDVRDAVERKRLEVLYPRRADVAKLDTDCEVAEAEVARLTAENELLQEGMLAVHRNRMSLYARLATVEGALETIRRKLLPLHRALTPTESAIEQACDAALAGGGAETPECACGPDKRYNPNCQVCGRDVD